MTQARPFTTTQPPPVESIGKAYFTPLMAIPVVTRTPQPAPNKDTISEYLRIQGGGGAQQVQVGQEGYFWQVSLILHSYAPDEDEVKAENNLARALGWGANAQGTYITTRSDVEWYVSYSFSPGLGTKVTDPRVALTRYRGLVTWRVPGRPLE